MRGMKTDDTGNHDSLITLLLNQVAGCLTPEVAQRIVQLRADPLTQARLDELATKCNEGQLSDAEQQEYEAGVEVIDFIAILQSKARLLLKKAQ